MADVHDITDGAPAEAEEPFDAEKSLAWLKEHGVEVETAEDRARKKADEDAVFAAQTPSADKSKGVAFTFVKLPAESIEPVKEEIARHVPGNGDVLPTLLAPRFADDGVLDADVVARETASTLKGMFIGGNSPDSSSLTAPTAEAVQRQAAGGACEAWPLSRASDANDFRAVSLYIDEVGALRARPRNARAEALAAACGLTGISIHGDAYVGRRGRAPMGGEQNESFAIGELQHDSKWVIAAARNHAEQSQALDYSDDAHLVSGGDETKDGYTWTQTEEDVEVRVSRGIPTTANAKKRIAVSYAKGASLTVKVDKEEVLSLPKLFDRVAPDECSWSLDKGVLVISMEKVDARAWTTLELPPHA